ncbi:MAG: MFS transporter [Akkermansia sp.]
MISLKKACFTLLSAGLLSLGLLASTSTTQAALSITQISEGTQGAIPPIPDATGRAGMVAAVIHDEGQSSILAMGGANFPNGMPWENGKKVFYKDIFQLNANNKWEKIGDLPTPVAYSAFATSPKGIIIAGGCSETGHSNQVFLVRPDGKTVALPHLPKSIAYSAFTVLNNRLYIIGGQENDKSTEALQSIYLLDLSKVNPDKPEEATWEQLKNPKIQSYCTLPDTGRIHAVAASLNGRIYIMGGCSLSPDAQGNAQRIKLSDVLVLNPSSAKKRWEENATPIPTTLAACASPAPTREGKIILIGGDDGSHYGKSPQSSPGQTNSVLVYTPSTKSWEAWKDESGKPLEWTGSGQKGIATVPAVILEDTIYTISGETAPGVRSPAVHSARLSYHLEVEYVDWALLGLGLIVLTILGFQVKKFGIGNIMVAIDPKSKPGQYAWVIVALLWFVAMLNYLDRQLLTTIREPIVNDIPQTEAQFGLLTAVFLFIYSILSPIGGFLADRFSRRVVILASLLVWSTVTWMTGHVHDYHQLFIARAIMGISEACYIPAALALITDYHRGRTRSLATGIHMSGVYVGMALAGYGGTLAEMAGWRLTFGLFGLVGVAYALVLTIFLKDPTPEGEPASAHQEKAWAASHKQDKPSIIDAFRNLFSKPAFWLLLGVMVGSGAANWLVLAWFPTLLKEKFNLTLGDAGIHATLWNTLAKYIAVIGGAIIADRWAMTNFKGRQLLAGIVFCIAAPLVGASAMLGNFSLFEGFVTGFGVFVMFIAFQGLAQGVLDATLMPILRSHIDERFSATGYGCLNLVSAGIGGLTVLLGGNIRDAGFDLTSLFAASSILILVCGLCLLVMPKPIPSSK